MTAKEKASIHFRAGMDAAMEFVIGLIQDSRKEQFEKPELLEGLSIIRQALLKLELMAVNKEERAN